MSKNKRIFLLVLLLTILSFSLSACWDKEKENKEVVDLLDAEVKTYTLAELKSEFDNAETFSS